jgi:hypothetical protein
VLEYRRQGQASWVTVPLVAGTLGTWVSGGIVANGSRDGRYEIGLPDAALASGARFVEVCLRGAANLHPVDLELELDAVNYQDGAGFGLSRMDAAITSRPTLAQIEASTILAKESTVNAVGTVASARPTLSQIEASTVLAKEASVNTVAAGVATLLGRITSGVGSMFLDLIQMITGAGTVNARYTAKALENAPTSSGAGTGTGARSVVVTVLLSGSPVEGAQVRLTKGAETYIGSSDLSGLVTFNVDDGTWVVSITSPGAYFTGASLVVDGSESVSYSLTGGSAIVPSLPGYLTGYWLCLSPSGVPESGVTVSMQVSALPSGSVGLALDNTIRGATSGVDGVAQFENLIPGVRYAIWRGAGDKHYVTIPSNVSSPLALNSIIGNP